MNKSQRFPKCDQPHSREFDWDYAKNPERTAQSLGISNETRFHLWNACARNQLTKIVVNSPLNRYFQDKEGYEVLFYKDNGLSSRKNVQPKDLIQWMENNPLLQCQGEQYVDVFTAQVIEAYEYRMKVDALLRMAMELVIIS
jgi:hypothetical protein